MYDRKDETERVEFLFVGCADVMLFDTYPCEQGKQLTKNKSRSSNEFTCVWDLV